MKNVKLVEIVDKKRLRIVFKNNAEVILKACAEDYGYDSGLYFEKDNVQN